MTKTIHKGNWAKTRTSTLCDRKQHSTWQLQQRKQFSNSKQIYSNASYL